MRRIMTVSAQIKGVTITRIFSPEHRFGGDADAGAKVGNQVDPKTGIPIASTHGSTYPLPVKPSPNAN